MNIIVFLNQFQGEKKLGGQELILNFQNKLETDIANKYNDISRENEIKKNQFEVSCNILCVRKSGILISKFHVISGYGRS